MLNATILERHVDEENSYNVFVLHEESFLKPLIIVDDYDMSRVIHQVLPGLGREELGAIVNHASNLIDNHSTE